MIYIQNTSEYIDAVNTSYADALAGTCFPPPGTETCPFEGTYKTPEEFRAEVQAQIIVEPPEYGTEGAGDYEPLPAAAAPPRPPGGSDCATNSRLDASRLTMTKTVEAHLEEYGKSGRPARPYGGSILTLQEIIDSVTPKADPQGVSGVCRWDVAGTWNGKSGTWELVINIETGTIYHFFFSPS
jgi:hypothetical protein